MPIGRMGVVLVLLGALSWSGNLVAQGTGVPDWGSPEGGVQQPPIADARFPTWVDFEGQWDLPNGNFARVDAVVSVREATFFGAGFMLPRQRSWGALVAWNGAPPQRYGQEYLLLTLDAGRERYSTSLVHWVGAGHSREACCGIVQSFGPQIKGKSNTYGQTPGGYDLDTWQFVAGVVHGRCGRQVFIDGVWGDRNPTCKEWPATLSFTTFGAYREAPGISHPYRGGLRDWVVVTGAPSTGELLRMRNGEEPRQIWGSRVWGAWRFTGDPASGQKEPDISGNGHHLTYGSRTPQAALPTLVRAK